MNEEELKKVAPEVLRSTLVMHINESSLISKLGYNPERQVLVVQFQNSNDFYLYANIIPDFHDQFMLAGSLGKFFSQRIKTHPDIFPCIKVPGSSLQK